jgi:hypothetical protein
MSTATACRASLSILGSSGSIGSGLLSALPNVARKRHRRVTRHEQSGQSEDRTAANDLADPWGGGCRHHHRSDAHLRLKKVLEIHALPPCRTLLAQTLRPMHYQDEFTGA